MFLLLCPSELDKEEGVICLLLVFFVQIKQKINIQQIYKVQV